MIIKLDLIKDKGNRDRKMKYIIHIMKIETRTLSMIIKLDLIKDMGNRNTKMKFVKILFLCI